MKDKKDQRKPDTISYEQREQLINRGRSLHSHAVYYALSSSVARIKNIFHHRHHTTRERQQMKCT